MALGDYEGEEAIAKEPPTVILLCSYTGKEYNDNDKQAIRSLVTELSLCFCSSRLKDPNESQQQHRV